MEKKFTPGPWKSVGMFINNGTVQIGQAFVKENWDFKSGLAKEDVEANANARLMAAAPELFDALDRMVALFPSMNLEQQDLKITAINALLKALGQTQEESK